MDDLVLTNEHDGSEQIRFSANDEGVAIVPAYNDEDTLLSRDEVVWLRDWLTEWLNA